MPFRTTSRSRSTATRSWRSAPPTTILKTYPNADVYDGRGKALFPGLINCHAHLAATLARGFNEDFGFPNSARLAVQPNSLLQGEEATLMVTVGALEAIRTGTTTIVENSGGISRHAAALAQTGLRCVFAESIRDSENVAGPMSPEGLARSEAPRFSPKLRDEGLQRINDLFSKWHGANQGRITVFPAAALAETSSPELLRAVRAFAEKHDLGYTIHLSQSRAEVDFMKRHHGVSPPAFLNRHGFLGPRLFAAHCRYVDDGRYRVAWPLRHDRVAPGGHGSEPWCHPADPRRCERRAAPSRTAPTTTPMTCSRS